ADLALVDRAGSERAHDHQVVMIVPDVFEDHLVMTPVERLALEPHRGGAAAFFHQVEIRVGDAGREDVAADDGGVELGGEVYGEIDGGEGVARVVDRDVDSLVGARHSLLPKHRPCRLSSLPYSPMRAATVTQRSEVVNFTG